MLFQDRREAGELLANKLVDFAGTNPLILAVPRGGVEVAEPIFHKIGGEIDLLITRKIGAPLQPELAIGAVTSDGSALLNETLISRIGVSTEFIKEAVEREKAEISRRLRLYRGNRPLPDAKGRNVILVDDGVATGYTLMMALQSLKQLTPGQLILAVPVGPPDTLEKFKFQVDRLIYIEAPAFFSAVGQFYRNFNQVSDEEVIAILQRLWTRSDKSN